MADQNSTTKPQMPSLNDLHWAQCAEWEAYQDRLGNLSTKEENAIHRAFTAGWDARGKLS